jgi:hypothetical protein
MDNINHETGLGGRILSALRMIAPVSARADVNMGNKEYERVKDLIDTLTEDLEAHPLYRMSKKYSLKNSAEAAVMFYDLSELFLRTPYLNPDREMASWFKPFSSYVELVKLINR